LTQLTTFLNTAINGTKSKFTNGCVLSLAIEECNRKITSIYMKVGKLAAAKKLTETAIMERLKWPMKKGECEKNVQAFAGILTGVRVLS
jgi:hypothetical protein